MAAPQLHDGSMTYILILQDQFNNTETIVIVEKLNLHVAENTQSSCTIPHLDKYDIFNSTLLAVMHPLGGFITA